MGLMRKRRLLLVSFMCLFIFISGCGPSKKRLAMNEFQNRVQSIHTIGMLPPDAGVFQLLTAGEREPMNEWTDPVGKSLSTAVAKELAARSFSVKGVSVNKETQGELEEIYYLYRAINESLHTEDDYKKLNLCANDLACPDYSVGPIEGFLKKQNVDALLAVYGYSEVESEGRTKAREKSIVISKITFFAPVRILPLRNTYLYVSVALIDKSGVVLWHGGEEKSDANDLKDLRSPEAVTAVVKEVVEKLFDR